MEFKENDLVTRKSYNNDIVFVVTSIKGNKVQLCGRDVRLIADAEKEDLNLYEEENDREEEEQENNYFKKIENEYDVKNKQGFFLIPGKVLHLDGDSKYLNRCMNFYKKLNVPSFGVSIKENELAEKGIEYIDELKPDIVVITGHDSYNKTKGEKNDINSYRNSIYFYELVKDLREKYPKYSDMVIIAGACQSHFEALINAGANFASSPNRVNIHTLDPAYIASVISYTKYNQEINVGRAIEKTSNGKKGMGGIRTNGSLYEGYPASLEK